MCKIPVLLVLSVGLGACQYFPTDPELDAPGMSPYVDSRVGLAMASLADPPPPISGGNLASDGQRVLVADSDRDRLLLVDLTSRQVQTTVNFAGHAEPGRVLVDGARGYVVLRGTGDIYAFDLAAPEDGTLWPVCAMPRGIAADAKGVYVACRGGELITLDRDGEILARAEIEGGDLRDVVLLDGALYVTRFRTAELLRVGESGQILEALSPNDVTDPLQVVVRDDGSVGNAIFHPSVAWRTVASSSGDEVLMVHQRASDGELRQGPGQYYSTGFCNGSIVQSAVARFGGGRTNGASPNLARASLTVDIAQSPDGTMMALANAGNQAGEDGVMLLSADSMYMDPATCASAPDVAGVQNPTSVHFVSDQTLVALQRDPAVLAVMNVDVVNMAATTVVARIDLGGESRFDSGHAIFHANASRGTACATCHPEGADDGRVWVFDGLGARRTPAMQGNVSATAPFHWNGELRDMRELARVVFTGRMSGPRLNTNQIDSLSHWLDELPPPTPNLVDYDGDAIQRGQTLFFGAADCGRCHSGPMLTNNETVDVGTGGRFQVPTLVGLNYRLPLMHDGCAQTIRERFEISCGGDRHGKIDGLSENQIADLVAYLATL